MSEQMYTVVVVTSQFIIALDQRGCSVRVKVTGPVFLTKGDVVTYEQLHAGYMA